MNKPDGVRSAVAKIITYILVALLVLGVAGAIAALVLRGNGITFYVEYGENMYYANDGEGCLGLVNGETHTFAVKSLTGAKIGYEVSVVACPQENFSFTLGEEHRQFYSDTLEDNDYSAVFGLNSTPDGFSIALPAGFTVEQAIRYRFGDVTFDGVLDKTLSYFAVQVTSDESIVLLHFIFDDYSFTLGPSAIVF